MTPDLRHHFPILAETAHGHALVWLDNAATTQKPRSVIEAISHYYTYANANVHRAMHTLSARATQSYEDARSKVRAFLNARYSDEIIWTRGATEALNLLACSWGSSNLQPGDEIILSAMDHHANIVPWQQVAEQTGALIRVIPVTETGELDLNVFNQLVNERTKLLAVTHVSNALGTINPIREMIARVKEVGATTVIDGSQAVAHFEVDVQKLGCDFYVFSGHKVYGPTGIGALYGRRELLSEMPPWQTGGEMITKVSFSGTTFSKPPFRFEAGTPNIAGAIGLAAAIDFLSSQDRAAIQKQEKALLLRLEQALDRLPGIRRIGTAAKKTAVVSFVTDGLHNQDMAVLLDQQGIAVRTGHHCAMPLMESLDLPNGTIRVSLACYNTLDDIDTLISALQPLVEEPSTNDEQVSVLGQGSGKYADSLPAPFSASPLYRMMELNKLRKALINKKNWQDRYRTIMQLAWDLPNLPDHMRIDEARLPGCESTVWMHHHFNEGDQTLHFAIDSDARVIRGLSVIVLACLNGRQPEDLLNCDIDKIFTELELSNHLSPSRNNGLRAIVQEIHGIAKRYKH